ncbi:hypothetical protein E3N88_43418 [Mikania micrantha]|uniref:Uncharacterized protein n=1 Tax=Mikania micrantha TaxID=192012 RepID=A0A5N6LH82_9ASTR|nr:hypothetical protein E3N88_43418 [Mikania micrantha]
MSRHPFASSKTPKEFILRSSSCSLPIITTVYILNVWMGVLRNDTNDEGLKMAQKHFFLLSSHSVLDKDRMPLSRLVFPEVYPLKEGGLYVESDLEAEKAVEEERFLVKEGLESPRLPMRLLCHFQSLVIRITKTLRESPSAVNQVKKIASLNTRKSHKLSFWNTNFLIQNAIPSRPGSRTYREWIDGESTRAKTYERSGFRRDQWVPSPTRPVGSVSDETSGFRREQWVQKKGSGGSSGGDREWWRRARWLCGGDREGGDGKRSG